MLHKDKGVKAYTACCIAELLNIYAPDAPYTAGELKVSATYDVRLHTLTRTLARTSFSSSLDSS